MTFTENSLNCFTEMVFSTLFISFMGLLVKLFHVGHALEYCNDVFDINIQPFILGLCNKEFNYPFSRTTGEENYHQRWEVVTDVPTNQVHYSLGSNPHCNIVVR